MPLAFFYRQLGDVWKFFKKREVLKEKWDPQSIILIVGSLKMGGGGRTPVAISLAQQLSLENNQVAVVFYSVYRQCPRTVRLTSASQALLYSDEAALVLAEIPNVHVFVTRQRHQCNRELDRHGYDYIIHDGGEEDPRLGYAKKIMLINHALPQSYFDIFPAGSCRSFLEDHQYDHLWSINQAYPSPKQIISVSNYPKNILGQTLPKSRFWFITTVASPNRIANGLKEQPFFPFKSLYLPDHSRLLPWVCSIVMKFSHAPIVLTSKDWIKLPVNLQHHKNIYVIKQNLSFAFDWRDDVS